MACAGGTRAAWHNSWVVLLGGTSLVTESMACALVQPWAVHAICTYEAMNFYH
jgi:hypothetical protein